MPFFANDPFARDLLNGDGPRDELTEEEKQRESMIRDNARAYVQRQEAQAEQARLDNRPASPTGSHASGSSKLRRRASTIVRRARSMSGSISRKASIIGMNEYERKHFERTADDVTEHDRIAMEVSKRLDILKRRARAGTDSSDMSMGMTDVAPEGALEECCICGRHPRSHLIRGKCQGCHALEGAGIPRGNPRAELVAPIQAPAPAADAPIFPQAPAARPQTPEAAPQTPPAPRTPPINYFMDASPTASVAPPQYVEADGEYIPEVENWWETAPNAPVDPVTGEAEFLPRCLSIGYPIEQPQ